MKTNTGKTDTTRSQVPVRKLLAGAVGLLVMSCVAAESVSVIEEVMVTAQKRSQSLNDVGIAVNAFSADSLKENRIEQMQDLGKHLANVQFAEARPGGNPKIVVRGIGVNDFLVSSNPSTAVYFDGVYSPSIGTISGQFFDLESLEVMKGPQTTLYGRNSTAGALTAVSRNPSQEFDAYATLGYGNFETLDLEGAIGGGLSDTVAGRVAFKVKNRDDGHMNNVFPGGQEIGTIDRTDVRAKLLWEASEDVEVVATVTYGDEDSVPGAWSVFGRRVTPGTGFRPLCAADLAGVHDNATCSSLFGYQDTDGDPYRLSEDNPWNVDSEEYSASLNISWDLGNATLRSTTGYMSWEQLRFQSDGIPLTEVVAERHQEISQVSQEFQLVSPGGEFVDWVVGAYFASSNTELFRPNITPIFGGDTVNTMDNDIRTAQAYAQLDWNLSERVQLITGLRYTWEENENIGGTWADNNSSKTIDAGDVRQAFVDDSFTENDISWKLGINYHPTEDSLLYASITRGFKSGGFFAGFAASDEQLEAYDDETIIAYELGFKSTLAEGTLQLNGSVFYYDYKDIQTNTNAIVGTTFITKFDNIEDAEVTGAELEAHWRLVPGLDLKLGLGYLDTEVGDFTFGPGANLVPSGNELPYAPHFTGNAQASYEWELNGDYRMAVAGSVSTQSEAWQEVENVARNRINTDYTLLDARLSLMPVTDTWELTAWGKNLGDEDYVVSSFQNPSNVQAIYNLPRTYGVSFTYYW